MMINGNITKWQVVEVESEIEIVGNNSWYLEVVDRHIPMDVNSKHRILNAYRMYIY